MTECIINQLTHLYEFVEAGDGNSQWVCKACGHFKTEWEDSCP